MGDDQLVTKWARVVIYERGTRRPGFTFADSRAKGFATILQSETFRLMIVVSTGSVEHA